MLQLLDIGLSLAREAHNYIATDARLRSSRSDGRDEVKERRGVAKATHPSKHRGARMLEGQIEVRRDTVGRRQDIHQAWPHFCRLQVGQPDAFNSVESREFRQQRLKQLQIAQVFSIRRRIFADEHQFPYALIPQPASLRHHVGRAPGHK